MGSIVCSDSALRALGLAGLLGALLAAPTAAQRLAGPAGLWVRVGGDSVVVHWLTDQRVEGTLRVSGPDSRPLELRTPAGRAHRLAFTAAGRDTVELRFGAAPPAGPEHRVRIGLSAPQRPASVFSQPDTLFVFGDTHGAYDQLIEGMRAAGIIDDQLRWSAGRSHVAFAGDMTDRGPDVLSVLWLLYELEPQARAAGGQLHVLLGNHEIMVMLGDLRYVHEKELHVARAHGVPYDELLDRHRSLLGRWLASKPAVVRIGDVLITHGGVAPEVARISIDAFNDTLARYVHDVRRLDDTTAIAAQDSAAAAARDEFFWGDRSVFWHRDYVRLVDADVELDETLRLWSARTMVIGHTAVPSIAPLYGGRVIAAHTPRFGAELLMLVRGNGDLLRYRVTTNAEPERF